MNFQIVSSLLMLALVLLAVGAGLCALVVVLLARAVTMPPRMTDGKAAWVHKRLSPGDLGLAFEDVRFEIRDARDGQPLRITGWWIPHPEARGRCVILIHGYADAKVGAIAWAPIWNSLGWNILAIDLRAHGESGGRQCTGGYFERHDVSDVIDRLRAERPDETLRLMLFGEGLGATVAVATGALRDDIDGVVLNRPAPDFGHEATLQMDAHGAPPGVLRRLAIRLAERMSGARFHEVRLPELLPGLTYPVLTILSEQDLERLHDFTTPLSPRA
jgi:pimeloyl-ACP methyl ester carboxylesterase